MDLAEAIALSPAVEAQLLVDSCARRFMVNDPEIDVTHLSSLRSFVLGQNVKHEQFSLKSLALLSSLLFNFDLEQFLRLSFLKSSVPPRLSRSDLSHFSIDCLDDLLSHSTIRIESEEALLTTLDDSSHLPILRHIRFQFLSPNAVDQLCDRFSVCDVSEWLWGGVVALFVPSVDSLIVSEIPPLFDDFLKKKWKLLWRGSRDGSALPSFTVAAMTTQTR
jgi:hypothetical protein